MGRDTWKTTKRGIYLFFLWKKKIDTSKILITIYSPFKWLVCRCVLPVSWEAPDKHLNICFPRYFFPSYTRYLQTGLAPPVRAEHLPKQIPYLMSWQTKQYCLLKKTKNQKTSRSRDWLLRKTSCISCPFLGTVLHHLEWIHVPVMVLPSRQMLGYWQMLGYCRDPTLPSSHNSPEWEENCQSLMLNKGLSTASHFLYEILSPNPLPILIYPSIRPPKDWLLAPGTWQVMTKLNSQASAVY